METDANDTAGQWPGDALSSLEAWSPDTPMPTIVRPGIVKAQLAAETLRLYAGDWAHFQDYCVERGAKAVPASAEMVAAFLASPGIGGAALARRLAAIDHQQRQRGLVAPGVDPSVCAVL